MQVCNPPEICQAHSQYPPLSSLREIPRLRTASLTYDGGPDSKLFPNRRVHLGNALVVASACQSSAAARAHGRAGPAATMLWGGRALLESV